MRPNEMIALKWSRVDFELKLISVREGRVLGIEGPPKTKASVRDVNILSPLLKVLRAHRMQSPAGSTYVFTNTAGGPLEVNNLRNNVWTPALVKAGLRYRSMYQCRHTFASLMLSLGEDPLWIARMLGHTSLAMVLKHYGKYIKNRDGRDGLRFVKGFGKAKVPKALAAAKDITIEVESNVVATNEIAS
jgi:integrase